MKIIIIPLILILNSCVYEKNNISDTVSSVKNSIFKKEIEDSLFVYQLIYTKSDSEIIKMKQLKVKDKISKDIVLLEELDIEIIENYFFFSVKEDFNFDGFNDIQLLNYSGAYNSCYSFWLYDNKNNRFNHHKGLDEMYNPIILNDKKQICSKYRVGLSDFIMEKYFWEKDSLILFEKHEEYWTDKGHLIITKLVNGEYNTKDSIINYKMIELFNCND